MSDPMLAVRQPLIALLKKSDGVKTRIAKCSVELGRANDLLKGKLIALSSLLAAEEMLSASHAIKGKVKECADDLHTVNITLAQTIQDLRHSETDLADSLRQLARTEAALAAAEESARRSAMLALHDPVTGLPNRRLFDNRLAQAIHLTERHGWTLAVMFLDLDRFKNVNDTLGHAAGDEVLREVARRLMLHTREEDTACRNGGDEFLFLLVNPQGRENIERIAGVILDATAAPVDTGRLRIVIKASIGIAVYPQDGTSGEALIRNADTAMYKAKEQLAGHKFF